MSWLRTKDPLDPRLAAELADANRRLINRENELERRQKNHEITNRIITRLLSPRDLERAMADVLSILCESTESAVGAVYLLKDGALSPFATFNMDEDLPVFKVGEGPVGLAFRDVKRVVTADIPKGSPFRIRMSNQMDLPIPSLIAQPLSTGEESVGVLVLGAERPYGKESLDLCQGVSVQMAIAVSGATAYNRLAELARELKFRSESMKKRTAELENALRAKSVFLAGVSHELKTPLNAIIGFSRILAKDAHSTDGDRAEYQRLILKNAEHLSSMINELLDLSKAESGMADIHRVKINISQLLDECVQSLHPLAGKKSQEMAIRRGSSIPGILADRGKVKQVVFNLLSNAIKFSPDGTRVEVGVMLNEYGDEVIISVTDQGTGVPEAERERIFDPFVRAPSAESTEGTGLGLALARKLVELHGGRIWVEPAPDRGSRFAFTLPVAGFDSPRTSREIVKKRSGKSE